MWRSSAASWTPATGRTAARPRARSRRMVKRNEQLPPDGEVARKLGKRVISALTANPLFISAAIPLQIFPPLFNRYAAASGHHFGIHVDNAVRGDHLTGLRIRTDLSVTLFCPSRRNMTAANWWSRTTTAPMRSSCRPGDCVLYPAIQPAHGHAGHARDAGRVVFLAAEHDPGCPRPQHDLRSRHGDPGAGRSGSGAMIPKRSN